MKYLKTNDILTKIFPNTFEGEGDGDAGAAGGGAGDVGAAGGGVQTFTQDQVDGIIANRLKEIENKHQSELKQQSEQLKVLRTKATLSDEEKKKYDAQIAELERKAYSAEELAAREAEKIQQKAQAELETLTGDRDLWRERYTEATIRRSIVDAAAANEAYNPSQIEAILRPNTKLVEVTNDDGVVTDLTPTVFFPHKDKEGNPTVLEVSPSKAIELLKEDPQFLNLFRGKHLDGLGSDNVGGSSLTLEAATKDLATYKKNREKILNGEIR
jgi:hypothetical protein